MKIKIINAAMMGVYPTYSNGDIVEVEYNVDRQEYIDTKAPFAYLPEWEGKYFEFVEEHQPQEWSGKGLPPVGTICEVKINNQEPREVEIVAYFNKTRSVVIYEAPWTPEVHEWDDCKFSPIKSEKDKEIDRIASELLESVNKNGQDFKHLEWEIAEHLYNAGLRFTNGELQ